VSIGKTLREKREERKLSVADVFAETKINKKYIQALEDDNFLLIPSQVYAKGFLKAYSIFLGLDTKSLVGELTNYYKNRESERKTISSAKKMPKIIPTPGIVKLPNIIGTPNFKLQFKFNKDMVYMAVLSVLVLLLLFILTFGYISFHKKGAVLIMANPPAAGKIEKPMVGPKKPPAVKPPAVKAPAVKAPAVTEEKTAEESSIPVGKIEVRIDTVGRSWIHVASGTKVLYSETLNAGAKLRFVGREITVKAGNGGGIKVYVNGDSQGLMGEEGVAAEKTYRASE
jgi:transcriptional regulator with XRE-family HTH domain